MSEQNKEIVRRFYENGAVGSLDHELIAEDLIYHGTIVPDFQGREPFIHVLNGFRSAFPGFTTEIKDMIAEGDRVAVHHVHRGTHAGDFNGIPATGRPIAVTGIEIVRVHDGQIAEFWHLDDFLGLMQQLGVVPALGQG
jgi:steroid delta-isomerase-like uncharacterized protein